MPSHVSLIKNKKKLHQKDHHKEQNDENIMEDQMDNGETLKEKGSEKVFIVKQEIKFARCLAGNDPKVRTRVLKNLKKWLKLRSKGSFRKYILDFQLFEQVPK